jgi:hypothetical protein
MKLQCPICGKAVERSPGAKDKGDEGVFPFCSMRCKLVDLGMWLDGEYRVESRDEGDEED